MQKSDWRLIAALFAAASTTTTIEAFAVMLAEVMGADAPAIGSLRRHSARDGWGAQRDAFQAARAAAAQHATLDALIVEDARHMAITRALDDMLMAQIGKARADTTFRMTGGEMARVLHEVFAVERAISAEARTIQTTMLAFYSVATDIIATIWSQSIDAALAHLAPHVNWNATVLAEARMAAAVIFGPETDRALRQHLDAVGLGDSIKIGN